MLSFNPVFSAALIYLWLLPLASDSLAATGSEPILQQGSYWDWQLTEPFDLSVKVKVLDLDPDSISPAQINQLKQRGVKTICYVSVGTLENYRHDAAEFPQSVLGDIWVLLKIRIFS